MPTEPDRRPAFSQFRWVATNQTGTGPPPRDRHTTVVAGPGLVLDHGGFVAGKVSRNPCHWTAQMPFMCHGMIVSAVPKYEVITWGVGSFVCRCRAGLLGRRVRLAHLRRRRSRPLAPARPLTFVTKETPCNQKQLYKKYLSPGTVIASTTFAHRGLGTGHDGAADPDRPVLHLLARHTSTTAVVALPCVVLPYGPSTRPRNGLVHTVSIL